MGSVKMHWDQGDELIWLASVPLVHQFSQRELWSWAKIHLGWLKCQHETWDLLKFWDIEFQRLHLVYWSISTSLLHSLAPPMYPWWPCRDPYILGGWSYRFSIRSNWMEWEICVFSPSLLALVVRFCWKYLKKHSNFIRKISQNVVQTLNIDLQL